MSLPLRATHAFSRAAQRDRQTCLFHCVRWLNQTITALVLQMQKLNLNCTCWSCNPITALLILLEDLCKRTASTNVYEQSQKCTETSALRNYWTDWVSLITVCRNKECCTFITADCWWKIPSLSRSFMSGWQWLELKRTHTWWGWSAGLGVVAYITFG